jgi:DNA-directed RNA polymerase subunit RPC12/RpoP
MAKSKKTKWYCIDCGYTETNHKQMDGCRCPRCGKGLWITEKVTADGK